MSPGSIRLFHSMRGKFRLEGPSGSRLRDQPQLLRTSLSWVLETSKAGGCRASLGGWVGVLMGKKLLLRPIQTSHILACAHCLSSPCPPRRHRDSPWVPPKPRTFGQERSPMLYNQAHQMSHYLLLFSENLAMAGGNLDHSASAGCPPSSFYPFPEVWVSCECYQQGFRHLPVQ